MRRVSPLRATLGRLASVGMALGFCLEAPGQGGFQPPTAESSVARRFDQIDALLADELWDEAIDLIETTQAEHGGQLHEIDPDRFVPVRLKCQQYLCNLTDEGLTAYRRRTDSSAERLLRRGVESLDRPSLELVVEEMLATSSGAKAAIALAELEMSSGDTVAARRWLHRSTPLLSGPGGAPADVVAASLGGDLTVDELAAAWRSLDRPGVVAASADEDDVARALARLASCALREGDTRRAAGVVRLMNALAPGAVGRIAGRPQPFADTLAEQLASVGASDRPTLNAGAAGPLVAWQWVHPFDAMRRAQQAAQIAQRNRQRNLQLQRLGFVQGVVRNQAASLRLTPSVGRERVLWVEGGKLRAVDRETGEPLKVALPQDWSTQELPTGELADANGAQGRWQIRGGVMQRGGQIRVLDRRGRLVTLPTPVVNWVGAPTPVDDVVYGRVSRRLIEVQSVNRRRSVIEESIVGIDLASEGKLAFELSGKEFSDDEAEPYTFVSKPVIDGERLYAFVAPRSSRGAVSVACYGLRPQRRLWVTALGAGSASMIGADLIEVLSSGDALIVSTGAGAVASLDPTSGEPRWVTRYASDPTAPKRGSCPRQLTLRGGLLLVAPPDSADLLAIDAASGTVVWSSPRDAGSELLDVDGDAIVLAGERLEWRDPLSGRTLRRMPETRHAGYLGVGRVALVGREIYFPTRESVLVIDAKSGRFTRPPIPLAGFPAEGADAYAAGDSLLLVGPMKMALRGAVPRTREPTLGNRRPTRGGEPLLAAAAR